MPELRIVLTGLALVVAMVLAGVIGWRQRIGSIVLALLSFVWFTVDRDFEGSVLVKFSATHGIVAADLVGIAGFVASALLWWRLQRSRR